MVPGFSDIPGLSGSSRLCAPMVSDLSGFLDFLDLSDSSRFLALITSGLV